MFRPCAVRSCRRMLRHPIAGSRARTPIGVRRPTTRPRWHCSPPARSQMTWAHHGVGVAAAEFFHSIHRFVIVSLCSNFAAGSGETTGICARGRIVYAELDRYDRPLRPASETRLHDADGRAQCAPLSWRTEIERLIYFRLPRCAGGHAVAPNDRHMTARETHTKMWLERPPIRERYSSGSRFPSTTWPARSPPSPQPEITNGSWPCFR